jgi:2-C-methyl-D-erythritol 4-phosphate cytidylyltransferase
MERFRNTTAIVPAGGAGKRMGYQVPKQYRDLVGRPIIVRTLQKLDLCPDVRNILVAVPSEFIKQTENILVKWKIRKVIRVVSGGKERHDSIRNALAHLPAQTELVLIHDAVRPFITTAKIAESIEAARRHGAVVLAVPSRNTIKEVRDGCVVRTLDRTLLWQAQTPQVFLKSWILEAYQRIETDALSVTDDAMLVERLGHEVHVVEGDENNIKITQKGDLILAQALAEREDR